MVIPFMTIYCTQRLHFSIGQAGFLMALFGVGAVAGSFIGGKIVDAIGFYWLQFVALFSGGIMFIIVGYLHTFFLLAGGILILSVCNESFRPANATAIAHYSKPENRTRSYSLNRLAINVGWGVGGALGGFIAAHNYQLLFWVDGLTNIIAACFLFYLLPAVKALTQKNKEENVVKNISPYKDKNYLIFILLVIAFAICFFQMFTMLPVFYKTEWYFNEEFIGVLMALNGLVIAVTEMVLIHKLEGKRNPTYFIGIGVILLGCGYILLNVLTAGKAAAIASIIVITFAEMLAVPFMNTFWISRSDKSNRGSYAALYAMAWSLAQIIAPTLGSQLIAHQGFYFLWWIVGGICGIIFVSFIMLKNKLS